MKMKKGLALVLSLLLLLGCSACGKEPEPTAPPTTVPVTTAGPTAQELYSEARAMVDDAADLTLRVTVETQTQVGGETFTQMSNQVVNYAGRGTEEEKSLLTEVVSYGDVYMVTYEEIFADGKVYMLVDGTYRLAGEDADYPAQQVPAVLLDAALYADMEAEETSVGTTITFDGASEAEGWAMPEGAEFENASGTVTLSTGGELRKSEYTITYRYGSTRVTETTSVSVDLEITEIPVPVMEDYTMLTDIETVRLSEQVCGNAVQSQTISSSMTETITSQAAGVVRSSTTAMDLYGHEELTAKVSTNVSLVNYTTGQSDSYTQEETFRDGVYTVSEDGGEAVQEPSVDEGVFREYCGDSLLTSMMVFDYWQDAKITSVGDLYYIECTYTEELGQELRGTICQTLFTDPAFLDNYATESSNLGATGYFAMDKYTGLPTAAGYAYAGSDVIDGQSYALAMQCDQTYNTPNLSVYKTLTGELLPETAPEQQATPLLYHVTGADGQEMYLMGTIHVGDERTAFLPQQVYDAFAACDALAVEFDIQAFEEQAKTDAQLQAMVAASYYYTDGTTAADHCDAELLEKALPFMKATGSYNANLMVMKPSLWANSLENFYLRQGYKLMSEKGMDNRLLDLAKEQGKEIRDIESAQLQMEMMGGYSDGVQQQLLDTAISYEPCEYWLEVEKLYEQWCRGDEAELRQVLSDESDLEEMTEEEKLLYDEYQQAMVIDRNEGMLSVAKDYLESGDKVFYAVGLAHLLQENGLVDTLRDAGYTVEQVRYE